MSKRVAGKELAVLVTEVERKEKHSSSGATFGDLIDAALEALRQAERSPKTLENYRRNADNWLRPRLGKMPVGKVTNRHLDVIYGEMRAAGRKPATIQQVHAFARKACNLAIAWGWITSNPTAGTSRPSLHQKRVTPPTVPQLVQLVGAAAEEDESMAVLLEVASGVGGRRGELCGLQWRDVDLEAGTVHVHQAVKQLPKAEGGWVLGPTKTHQVRTVDLPASVVTALRKHRADLEERASLFAVEFVPHAFVFSRQPDCSEPLWPDWVTAAFERARARAGLDEVRSDAGLDPIRLHDLRHLNATLQLAAGVPLHVVTERLGWRDPTMLLNVYGHAMPGAGKDAAAVLDGLLGATRSPQQLAADHPTLL